MYFFFVVKKASAFVICREKFKKLQTIINNYFSALNLHFQRMVSIKISKKSFYVVLNMALYLYSYLTPLGYEINY